MSTAAQPSAAPAGKQSCELADVLARYGDAYTATHRLTPARRKVMWAIRHCRTAVLGGQRYWCDACGYQRYVYHSCRNRHCPKCQSRQTAQWVQARCDELLPVPYFHNVFTLPHELNALILRSERNQRALLKLLFDAASATLLEFGRTTFDGGKIGFTLVLHTWDQQLRPHFHVHALIASGALSRDATQWIAGGSKFLFPVRGLSKMFRAKYLDGLAELLEQGALDVPSPLAALGDPDTRRRLLRQWRKKPWVVYSKAPFAGPKKLVDYLGRYTHRAAISDHRLVSCDEVAGIGGQVRFSWRDRRDGDRKKTMSLPAEVFIHRFLQHVLPDRFTRVRHYGLLANRGKQDRLARCRQLLGARGLPADQPPQTANDWMLQTLGIDITRCPCCGEPLDCQTLAPCDPPASHLAAASLTPFSAWDTS